MILSKAGCGRYLLDEIFLPEDKKEELKKIGLTINNELNILGHIGQESDTIISSKAGTFIITSPACHSISVRKCEE